MKFILGIVLGAVLATATIASASTIFTNKSANVFCLSGPDQVACGPTKFLSKKGPYVNINKRQITVGRWQGAKFVAVYNVTR